MEENAIRDSKTYVSLYEHIVASKMAVALSKRDIYDGLVAVQLLI